MIASAGTKKEVVRIHIDRKPYEMEHLATGADLYKLSALPIHRELFRVLCGDHEDVFVPNDNHQIELKNDDHFYSQKEFKIFINGRKVETVELKLCYDELIKKAFESPPTGPNILFTITYRNGPRQNREGSLAVGQCVKIKNGMVFNVTATDKS